MAREIRLVEINLLPVELRQKKLDISWLFDARVVWSTFALVLVGLIIFLLYYHVVETTADLKQAVEQTKQAIEKERPLLEKIKDLDEKLKVIEQKSAALRSIQVSRKRWVLLFEDLSTSLPPGTWINSITQNAAIMDMSCATWNFSEIALYMLKLEQQESVTSVELININSAKINNEDAYNFTLKVGFNPDLGLETGVR